MSHQALISPIREWLIDEALGNPDITELFETLCLKMSAVGIPVTRARLFWPTLHPLFQAETVMWTKGSKAVLEQFEHEDKASVAWTESPLKYVVDNNLDTLRREMTGPNRLIDFPLISELEKEGYTDFIVMSTKLDGTSFRIREGENDRGILVSWSTNNKDRFSDEDLIAMQKLQRRFAVACKVIIQSRISNNIALTYLGNIAGRSVLDGQIRRGDGQNTKAVIWFSDMRDSTHLAETMPADEYFKILNSYFTATAQPIIDNGGQILDFIGDAVLGIFPYQTDEELKKAANAAEKALADSCKLADELNLEREKSGLNVFKYGIGLNVGDVMFGNIGIPSRLSFSVIGPAVNEAARIENLTKTLDPIILAGKSFAQINPDNWKSLGKQSLQGVAKKTEVFEIYMR